MLVLADYAFAGLASLVGETFGSVFGGGSFLIQPSLLAIGVPARIAVANDVTAAAFSSLFFVGYSLRKQPIDKKLAGWMLPALALGAIFGGLLLSRISDAAEFWIILTVCCCGLIYNLYQIKNPAPFGGGKGRLFKYWQPAAVLTALAFGMYDGISGAGGGVIMITALTVLFRKDMKSAIMLANLFGIISLSTAGLTFWRLGLLDAHLLMAMIPACCLAGIFAAKIVHAVPEKPLRIVFVCMIAALIARLGYRYIS